ncbi:MAG: plasmid stabilization system protein [Armatimonadetes bacterium CSP1-3]|nr:MAG: plasmid stabilization system protein [Armatimonadetes bacterium CSP1-3]
MRRVIWTRQAVEDVEAIKAYVARDSERYAVLLAERLVAAIERVGLFPESGRVVPEVNDATLREVVYGNYRIVYRVLPEAVEVVTVYHGARLLRL